MHTPLSESWIFNIKSDISVSFTDRQFFMEINGGSVFFLDGPLNLFGGGSSLDSRLSSS